MAVLFDSNVNGDKEFMETATVGGFENTNASSDFDAIFESAVDRLENAHTVNFQRGFVNPEVLKRQDVVSDFKHDLLGQLQEDVSNLSRKFEGVEDNSGNYIGCGNVESLYDRTSQLFDNKVEMFYEAGQSTGQMEPVKTIDYPILVKENVANFFKDIVNEEVSSSLIIKKQIEHHIVYSKKDPTKKWEYPMCLYDNDEFNKIMEEGKGTKLSSEPQTLPLYGFNIVEKLTDVPVPSRERITSGIEIDRVVTADGDTVILSTPMFVSQSDGAWLGGKIHQTYTKSDGTKGELNDILSGFMDWFTGQTSLTSASNQITAVCFSGRLSNENNQNSIRHEYLRNGIEWRIDEGAKTDAAYTLEELQENKAMLNIDLYKKSYNDLCQLVIDIENFSGLKFLDDEFAKYDGVELDPLYWNSLIKKTTFDCDSSIATTALPSEYLHTELKFHIDRFLIAIADEVKIDNLRFVCWGNPRYISLLQPNVKWIFNAGDRIGGVKLNYSYGVMTTGDTSVFVVSIKELNAKKYRGLRFLPFSTEKDTITFKRFKFSTDVVTAKESAYHDTEKPGGTMTYVFATSRFKDISLQGIQGELMFKNASFVQHLL